MDLEKEIINIQRSTHTLFRFFIPIHEWLRLHNRFYYFWSARPYARVVHWTVLFLLFISIISAYSGILLIQYPETEKTRATTYDYPRWQWANPLPTGTGLNSTTVCPDNSLLSAGDAGIILKSTDSGATWKQQYTGTSSNIAGIVCISSSKIIAVGYDETILEYNGIAWTTIQTTGSTYGFFTKIIATDSNHVLTNLGTVGQIVALTYNGTSWVKSTIDSGSETINSIAAIDSTHALAVGNTGKISALTYNGSSWTASAVTSGTESTFQDIAAIDSTHALAVGWNQITALTFNGSSWDAATVSTASNLYFSVSKVDSTHALAVSGSGKVMALTYNGSSWEAANVVSGTAEILDYVASVDSTHAIATGFSGYIIALTYNGSAWSASTVTGPNSTNYLSVTKINATNAIDVGSAGQITLLSFSGGSWTATSATSGSTNDFKDIAVADATHAIVAGWTGQISALTYDGSSWSTDTIASGIVTNYNAVAAPDASHAIAVGDAGKISAITFSDGSWSASNVVSGTASDFRDIAAADATHALAVGWDGQITALTYSESSWSAAAVPTGDATLSFQSVVALDSTHAITVGYQDQITLLTYSDSSWSISTITNDTSGAVYETISKIDSTQAIAAGSSGQISFISYNGSTWNSSTIASDTDDNLFDGIAVTDSTHILLAAIGGGLFVSGHISALNYNGSAWVASTILDDQTRDYTSIVSTDATHALATSSNGDITNLTYNGSTWTTSTLNIGTTNWLNSATVISSTNILTAGSYGTILHYTAPADSTATKLLIKLPGQDFADGTGIYGSTTTVAAGDTVSTTIYAVDSSNNLDKGNASTVGFTTTDPADSNPAEVQLTQGGTCVQVDRQSTDPVCGIGTANFMFKTAGDWTITGNETGGLLTSAVSESIHVTAGNSTQLYFSSPTTSPTLTAGSSSQALTLGFKDQFGNIASASSTYSISLTSSDSTGRFSTTETGPWSTSLTLPVTSGSSSVSFYYLNYAAVASTISASATGLTGTTLSANINPGTISALQADGSDVITSTSSSTVGDPNDANYSGIAVTVSVKDSSSNKNPISGKTVSLYSTRGGDDSIAPSGSNSSVTDSSGNATFAVKSKKVGTLNLYAKVDDGAVSTWLEAYPSVGFTPDKVAKINLSVKTENVIAGEPISLKATLYDNFDNLATNTGDILSFSSSDDQAELPDDYQFLSSDNGEHNFSGFVLKSAGLISITVKDKKTLISSKINFNIVHSDASAKVSSFTAKKDNGGSEQDKLKLILNIDRATLNVKATDKFGNPIKNEKISLEGNTMLGTIENISEITDENGTARFKYTPKAIGTDVIVAHDLTAGFDIENKVAIEILPDTFVSHVSSTIDSLKNSLQNSPTAKKIADIAKNVVATTAVLGLIPLVANVIGNAPAALHALSYAISLALEALGIRKKRKSWGRVFDTTNGKGVDMALVRLYDSKTMRLITTAITDVTGRYNFAAKNGSFVISVSKEGYIFPTEIFAKYGLFDNREQKNRLSERHYLGQPIEINEENPNLNIDIPIDPIKIKAPFFLKIKLYTSDLIDQLIFSLSNIFIPLMIVGVLFSLFTALVLTTTRNIALSVIYIIVTAIYIIGRAIKAEKYGFVYNSDTKKAIPGAVVSVFDVQHNSLKETRVTDKFGRFSIFVPEGNYYIRVQKNGYVFVDAKHKEENPSHTFLQRLQIKKLYRGETITFKNGAFINERIEGKNKNLK